MSEQDSKVINVTKTKKSKKSKKEKRKRSLATTTKELPPSLNNTAADDGCRSIARRSSVRSSVQSSAGTSRETSRNDSRISSARESELTSNLSVNLTTETSKPTQNWIDSSHRDKYDGKSAESPVSESELPPSVRSLGRRKSVRSDVENSTNVSESSSRRGGSQCSTSCTDLRADLLSKLELEILKKQADQLISNIDFNQKTETSKTNSAKSIALILSENENENAVNINNKRKFSQESSTAVQIESQEKECQEKENEEANASKYYIHNEHETWKNYNKILGVGLVFAILSIFMDSTLFFTMVIVVLGVGLIVNNYPKFSKKFNEGKKMRSSRRITAARQSVVG